MSIVRSCVARDRRARRRSRSGKMPNFVGRGPGVERLAAALERRRRSRGLTRIPIERPGCASAHAIDLRQEVDVQVHARMRRITSRSRSRHVRAGVADLRRRPPVIERPPHLAGRADVHADAVAAPGRLSADEPEQPGSCWALSASRTTAVESGTVERRAERARLLLDADQVVGVDRRAVLAGDRLGVASGDVQTTAPDVESGAGPPRMRVHLRLRHGGSGYRSGAQASTGSAGARWRLGRGHRSLRQHLA